MTTLSKTKQYDDVAIDEDLPEFPIELTPTRIISTAIATRDYQPVHHDPDGARERGSDDIIMNILTTNGFVGRFVTDWAGPEAFLRRISIRLGAPNHPGDTMVMTGRVVAKDDDTGVIEVAITGANSLGNHVTGTVAVELPNGA